MDFNIDGVKYNRNAKANLWLIQMDLRTDDFDPFVVGVYKGIDKPDCNEFLDQLVDELNSLSFNDFETKTIRFH